MSAHALLSASSAHRWINCTKSVQFERDFPDTASDYAAEGTLAHHIAELKLRRKYEGLSTRAFNKEMKAIKENALYQEEMQRHTDFYVELIDGLVMGYDSPPHIGIEIRVDYSHIAPEGFGTADCILLYGDALTVIDFKYGKGVPVNAVDNMQMALYALGAAEQYGAFYPVNGVTAIVVQPRLDSVSEWHTDMRQLHALAADIIAPRAQLAYKGEGEFSAGEHCRFCRARQVCRARAAYNLDLESYKREDPNYLSNSEIGDILGRGALLKKWVEDIEDYALTACLNGEEIPGWKAVHGRSLRKFIDVDAAISTLIEAGYDEALFYTRKPNTLTEIEKTLGKKDFEEKLSDYIEKPPGKPTLAPDTDKREAITNKVTAAEAFGPAEEKETA